MSFPRLPAIGSPFSPPRLTGSSLRQNRGTELARVEAAANDRFASSSHISPASENEDESWYDEIHQLGQQVAAEREQVAPSFSSSVPATSFSYIPPQSENEDESWYDEFNQLGKKVGAEMAQVAPSSYSSGPGSPTSYIPPQSGNEDGVEAPSTENGPKARKKEGLWLRTARKARESFEPALWALAKLMNRETMNPFHPEIVAWKQEYLPEVDLNLNQCVACKETARTTCKIREVGITLCHPCRSSIHLKKRKLNKEAAQPEAMTDQSKRPRLSHPKGRPVKRNYRSLSPELIIARDDAIQELVGIALDQNPVPIEETQQLPSLDSLEENCQVCKTAPVQKTSQVAVNTLIKFCKSCYRIFHQRKYLARKALSAHEQLN